MAESHDLRSEQQPAGWNQPCLEDHLAEISISITEWREISPFLGLTKAEEHEILGAIPPLSVLEQKIAMLRLWKKKKRMAATYNQLCRAFRKSEQLDLEDKMKEILAKSSMFEEKGPSSLPPHAGVPAIEQHSDHITSYSSYLRELYISMSHSCTSQHWTHLPRCEFIQLTMIGAQGLRRGGPEEEMIRLAQQGKIETILSHKQVIGLHDLFSLPVQESLVVPPLPGRVCLIEGAPGGGKSTLAFHICHQWAQGASWLARFDLVILAYLRDQAIQNATTFAEILPARNSELAKSVASQMQATNGKNVLFIFDGWNEFPHHLMDNSVVSTIIRQPYKLSLHLRTVLITTRPVSSGYLLHIADRRVEILGFTQHQIREYIEKALAGNSTHIQKLVQHLEDHPVIEGYCYVPLHVAILVHIFLTMKGALPTTLHELFSSLVLCCIVREHVTREPDTSLPELTSLDDLPDDLKSKLINLSILAYNGVMQNKVVFYSKDLQKIHLPSNLSSLGLLQAVKGLTLLSVSLSYNFLHLSVQELLAAYNISQMDPSEQVKVFKILLKSSRFQAVLHYYCGFTKLANREIQAFISSFQSEKSSFKDILPLLHCFFEAQQPSLCQLVDSRFVPNEKQKLNSRDLTIVDFLVIGYFIISLLSTSTANTPTIHLVVDGIDDDRLKMLLIELSKYPVGGIPTSAGALSFRLHLCKPSLTGKGVNHIAFLLQRFSTISELVLSDGNIRSNEDVLLPIAKGIQMNSSLTKLSLPHMSLHHTKQNGFALIKMLEMSKSLTHLDLSWNDEISDSGARCIFEGLQNNTSLVNLNLSQTGITATDPDTARSLTEMLQVNKSLTHLNLSKNSLLDSGALCIFEGLQHNIVLVNLNLSQNSVSATDPVTARSLTKMLQINKSLTHLDLSKNTLSDSGAHSIFEGLHYNTTLVSLNLSQTGLTATDDPDTARSLTKMLHVNKSLTRLDLSDHDFSYADQMILCIFEGLKHNSALRYLDLHAVTGITDVTAEHIAEALQSNCTLQTLDISQCSLLGHNGINFLLQSLMFNSTLQTLYVSHIDSDTLSTFKRARETKNLPPIDITLTSSSRDTHMRSQSPVLSSAGRLSPLHDSQRSSPLSQARHVSHDDAMKSLGVTVTMEIINIGTQGYPGVGKTSVLDLAMGNDPALIRNSTDCVDPPLHHMMIKHEDSDEAVKWEKVTTEKMFQMVCEAMRKTTEENSPDNAELYEPTAIVSQFASDTKRITPAVTKEQASHPASSSNQTPDLPSTEFFSESVPDTPSAEKFFESIPDSIFYPDSFDSPDSHSSFTVFPELLQKLSSSGSSGVIFNSHWMMVTDCGGQPPFLDAAALFLQNSCLQIFPVKLNEHLSKNAEFSYFVDGKSVSFGTPLLQLTNLQTIETLAKSVASYLLPYTPSATKCPTEVKFTIVGTFEDEAHKCSETVEEKESILKDVLEPYESFRVQLGNKVILPINATAIDTKTKKKRTESAEKLRKLIKASEVSMEKNVKLSWFGFLLSILTIIEKRKQKAVLTLDECYKLGETLGMDKLETKRAIRFFHDISLIMHFDTPKLRDSVIIDTKMVFKKLSRLLSVSFLHQDFLCKQLLTDFTLEKLQHHGLFTKPILEKYVDFQESEITTQFFLDILEHKKVITAINGTEYFIPCALTSIPEDNLCAPVSSDPWVIRLKLKSGPKKDIPMPMGYLPTLVIFLIQDNNFSFNYEEEQYRNVMNLQYKSDEGTVFLVERHLQLEVYYSLADDHPDDCSTIRCLILQSMQQTQKELHIREDAITIVDSFLCSCGEGSAHHVCTYKPDKRIGVCCEKGTECDLDTPHLRWLSSESLPDVEILAKVNFLFNGDQSPLMFSWEEYGLKLHVSERSTASFKVRVVNPRTFELPEGTELLSPFYWVTSEGDTAGPVGVEIQHCAHVTKKGLSGLGFAMHKVQENHEPPYCFEEVEGHLSSTSGYARIEVQFSDRILALFRRIKIALHLETRFQARLYYYNELSLTTKCTAHLVIVPDVNACQRFVQEKYGSAAKIYVSGAEDLFFFKEEKITLALDDGPLDCSKHKNGWEITPMNPMKVTKEIANRSYTGPAGLNPRMLRLKWSGDGEPQQWDEKIILTGSEDLNFLLLTQPTAPIGASADQTDQPYTCTRNPQEDTADDMITLGIGNLVDVKKVLKRVNDWQSLGLELGLLFPTLQQIKTNNPGNVEQCKTNMIAAWLNRQDNVPKVGVPTWSVLQTALRKIGEGEVANELSQIEGDVGTQ